MVGPVIVQERAGVAESFRRTLFLRPREPPTGGCADCHPVRIRGDPARADPYGAALVGYRRQVVAEWIVAIVVGGTLGLLEVALATELMARYPRQPVD